MKNGFKLHTIKNLDENNVLCIVLIENCTRNILGGKENLQPSIQRKFSSSHSKSQNHDF